MKKTIGALCLSLFGATTAMAHPGHRSTPHIHITESVTMGTAIVLATVIIIAGLLFIKEQRKKDKSHA